MAANGPGSNAEALTGATPVSDALRRLAGGEIGIEEYLDARADGAVEHLRKLLPDAKLKLVRETIREQLTTDPVVIELVRRATGYDLERTGTR
jgi:hypothetical protein